MTFLNYILKHRKKDKNVKSKKPQNINQKKIIDLKIIKTKLCIERFKLYYAVITFITLILILIKLFAFSLLLDVLSFKHFLINWST